MTMDLVRDNMARGGHGGGGETSWAKSLTGAKSFGYLSMSSYVFLQYLVCAMQCTIL